jgi:hypothetical protein
VTSTFDPPHKSRVAEGWAAAVIVAFLMFLLWLAI